ncbi:MAG: phosphatase PAP2 family protein [Polyangiaceae bacterium]|nr:phosphatase PAP2 family protein [Polyangiaceae bacterium]
MPSRDQSRVGLVKRRGISIACALAIGVASVPAAAQSSAPDEPADRFTHDLALDLPVTFIAGSLWLGTQLLQVQIAPKACRWCDRSLDGSDTLNGFDRGARDAFRWTDTELANGISDGLGYVVSPGGSIGSLALVAGLDGRLEDTAANTLVVMESAFIAGIIAQLFKFTVGRERPFVHVLGRTEKSFTKKPQDNNVSFFSAHANFAFALAVSSGMVATLRDYRGAPWVWGSGLLLASTIGYLRVAADRHYLSDVLVGAAMGSIVGFSVPFFFHRKSAAPEATKMAPSAISAGASHISFTWQF